MTIEFLNPKNIGIYHNQILEDVLTKLKMEDLDKQLDEFILTVNDLILDSANNRNIKIESVWDFDKETFSKIINYGYDNPAYIPEDKLELLLSNEVISEEDAGLLVSFFNKLNSEYILRGSSLDETQNFIKETINQWESLNHASDDGLILGSSLYVALHSSQFWGNIKVDGTILGYGDGEIQAIPILGSDAVGAAVSAVWSVATDDEMNFSGQSHDASQVLSNAGSAAVTGAAKASIGGGLVKAFGKLVAFFGG